MASPAQKLAALIAQTQLRPSVDAARIAQPAQYDVMYNAAITACGIVGLGSHRTTEGARAEQRVNATVLKFGHFLAVRPALLPNFREWVVRARQGASVDLLGWPLLPRGYLSDETQSSVVSYLTAIGCLLADGRDIVLPLTEGNPLVVLLREVEQSELFLTERSVISELRQIRVTQVLLGVA